MKFLIFFFLSVSLTSLTLAQPKIKFDTTSIDFGIVTESSKSIVVKYAFTNIGTEPLIISQVQTSCGCLVGEWPKEPILPGKRDFITLKYDGKRIGITAKTATVTSNAVNEGSSTVLKITGEVLLKRTTIKVSKNDIDMGTITYGEIDTLSFIVTNSGDEPLHFNFLSAYYGEKIDVFSETLFLRSFKNEMNDFVKSVDYGKVVAQPNEQILVQVCLRNVFGNVGQIERNLYFKYNSHDTLKYTVKVNYAEKPAKQIIYEQGSKLEYNRVGGLFKRTVYTSKGDLMRVEDFENGHIIHSVITDFPSKKNTTEYFFKDDLMVEKVTTNKE